MPDTEWQARVEGIFKGGLKRRNVSYKQLAERLEAMGIHETERNINNKISRGGFTAVLLIQCLEAAGCEVTPRLGGMVLIVITTFPMSPSNRTMAE